MLNCKQTSQLVSQALDRKLRFRERLAVNLHLLICKYCRRFNQQITALRVNIKRITQLVEDDSSIEMPPEAKSRMAEILKNQQ
jgi:predicted anti-sigma-YlaC factor YlaD